MRILTACIGHETNTFASTPTTLEDFRRGSPTPEFGGGAAILHHFRGTRTVHGGYIAGAEKHGFNLEPLMHTFATPGGTVPQNAYDSLKGLLLERLKAAGQCDGILLDLHGAMVTEAIEDAEGDLLAAVRAIVGSDVPLIVTLDFHANVTAQMAQHADVIIGFDEYPHTDMFERGMEAVEVLAAMQRGTLRPTLAYHQLPLLTMPPKQCTLIEPMRSLLAKAHAIESERGVINVTLAMGFPFADIRNAGVSVLVTTNDDAELARRKAAAMAEAIWEKREAFHVTLTPVAEVIEYARTQARGLVVLADGSDNPGGGAPCDGTVILREFLEKDVQDAVVAVIADPQAVAAAVAAGVGNTVTLDLGGKTDHRHGAPVRLTAHVKLVSDGTFTLRGAMGGGARACMGRTAVLVVGGVEIVVTERRIQPYDVALLRSVGIEPTQRRLIALKSAVHFRSTYQDLAERIFDADTPGVHRPDFRCYEYRRLRRPVYPLEGT
ncbi:MAG: M81 family metallopeptidase [Abditibacteriales bacterium]|nr:M81 family metallopeptidase [Abditibacteriales bacterium]MDW8365198.1 M81 family metallopeptidase [Abditibacteriales bacterium]